MSTPGVWSGLSARNLPYQNDTASTRFVRIALYLLAFYLLVALIPLAHYCLEEQAWLILLAHIGVLGATLVFCANVGGLPSLRDWMPLLLIPYLYFELRWVIPGTGAVHYDHIVTDWERALFSDNPSSTLAVRWKSTILSEVLHLCYLSYYALIAIPPALLLVRGRRKEFHATSLAIVLVYVMCFATYLVFPVDGPRYVADATDAPSGLSRMVVLAILNAGASRGTAFPSSHVAASLVALVCAWHFQRRVAYVGAVLTIGLTAGTVYGGFHYAVDVLGGIGYAIVAIGISNILGAVAGDNSPLNRYDHVKVHVMRARLARTSGRERSANSAEPDDGNNASDD